MGLAADAEASGAATEETMIGSLVLGALRVLRCLSGCRMWSGRLASDLLDLSHKYCHAHAAKMIPPVQEPMSSKKNELSAV
jgi:hypothetical protein